MNTPAWCLPWPRDGHWNVPSKLPTCDFTDLTEIQQPLPSPLLSQETCSFSLRFPTLLRDGKNSSFSLAATFAFTPIRAFSSLKKRPSCFSGSSASQAPGLKDHCLDKSEAGVGSLFTGLLRLGQVPVPVCTGCPTRSTHKAESEMLWALGNPVSGSIGGEHACLQKTPRERLCTMQASHPVETEACGRTIMVGFLKLWKRLKMANASGHKEK